MSRRAAILNLGMRLLAKPALARLKDPAAMRARFERNARDYFVTPADAHFVDDLIRRPGFDPMDAVWASCGRPDRRKVILYLHGGAYLAGTPRTHQHLAAFLARAAGVRAVLPDYRLAPEHPFPAAVDDAEIAYRHLLEHGYEAGEIAVAGDSAGGGLAFSLVLRCARAGLPQPACLCAFSPWADMTETSAALSRNAARDVLLPVRRISEVTALYLAGHDPWDPEASPAHAPWSKAAHAPPPAMLMASRNEILVDDAETLANALRQAQGDVRLELWRTVPHAWPLFAGWLPEADTAVASAGAFIARHLSQAHAPAA